MINLQQGCMWIAMMLASQSTMAALPAFNPTPYISADVGYRDLDFMDNYGGNIFKSSLPQAGIQVGMRLWQYLGFQLGYERSRREGRTTRIGSGQTVLGRTVSTNGSEHHATESGLQGQHFDALFFLPTHPLTAFDLIFSLGIVRSKLLHEDIVVGINDDTLLSPIKRTFRQKQTHYRVGGGIQKMIKVNNTRYIKHAGLRALAVWENTSRHKSRAPLEANDAFVSANNSYIFSVGVVLSA